MAVSTSEIAHLFSDVRTEDLEKNKLVYYRNEIPRKGRLIVEGTVRVFILNSQGVERNITLLDAGDLMPIECVLSKERKCRYFYETITKVKACSLPLKKIREEISSQPEVVAELLDKVTNDYLGTLIQIEAFGQPKVREKIIYILRYLLQRHGISRDDGWWEVNVRLTHNDIANMIGIARETVALEMGKLKSDNIIGYKKFRYSLNLPELIKLTSSEDWKDFLGNDA